MAEQTISIRIETAGGRVAASDLQRVRDAIAEVAGGARGGATDLIQFRGALSSLRAGAAAAVGGLSAYLSLDTLFDAGRELLTTNREFERFLAQLETLQGSAAGARGAFQLLEDFATSTPFQLDELVEAFIILKTVGIEPTEQVLTSFGNTASAFGRGITDYAEAVRGALTGEMERLKAFGIVARQDGDQIAFTFRGQTTIVRRSTDEILSYLQRLGEAEFAGSMAREMDTLNGVISNIEDGLSSILRISGEGGLNAWLKELGADVLAFTDRLAENREGIAYWTRFVIESVEAVVRTITGVIRVAFNVGNSIGRVITAILADLMFLITETLNQLAKGANWIIEQLNRIPGVDIEFRFGGLDSTQWLDLARAQIGAFVEDGQHMFDALQGIARSWMDVYRAATSAGDAQAKAATATLTRGGGGLGGGGSDGQGRVGIGFGIPIDRATAALFRGERQGIGLRLPQFAGREGPIFGVTTPTFAERFQADLFAGMAPLFEARAIGFGGEVDEALAKLARGRDEFDATAEVVVGAMGDMAVAAIEGSDQMATAVIGGISRILSSIQGFGLVGTIVGAVGGIVGALFGGGRDRPVRVRVEDYGERARAEHRERKEGPDRVVVQVVAPDTGELLQETEYELRRRTRRDATVRIPTGARLSRG